jgi:hypothetical protein
MQIDFQHSLSRIHKACLSSRHASPCRSRPKSPANYILETEIPERGWTEVSSGFNFNNPPMDLLDL